MVVGGTTWDTDYRKYKDYTESSALIASYAPASSLEFAYDWAYTLRGGRGYIVRDVSFSVD